MKKNRFKKKKCWSNGQRSEWVIWLQIRAVAFLPTQTPGVQTQPRQTTDSKLQLKTLADEAWLIRMTQWLHLLVQNNQFTQQWGETQHKKKEKKKPNKTVRWRNDD